MSRWMMLYVQYVVTLWKLVLFKTEKFSTVNFSPGDPGSGDRSGLQDNFTKPSTCFEFTANSSLSSLALLPFFISFSIEAAKLERFISHLNIFRLHRHKHFAFLFDFWLLFDFLFDPHIVILKWPENRKPPKAERQKLSNKLKHVLRSGSDFRFWS